MGGFQVLLVFQVFLGALDTVWHHELTEQLANRERQRRELAWHACRSLLYGLLLGLLAWVDFRGAWLLLPLSLFSVELMITLADFVEEDQSRLLPPTERILHTVMAINAGALLVAWLQPLTVAPLPSTIAWRSFDGFAAFLTVMAGLAMVSGLRDAFAAKKPLSMNTTLLPQRPLRVLITGGSGFIGSTLVHRLLGSGHHVSILSRQPRRTSMMFAGQAACFDRIEAIGQQQYDLIINLAGAPVVGLPWTKARRRVLWDSRVTLTRDLVTHLATLPRKDRPVFVQASAMGYYGQHAASSREQDPPGVDFGGQLCAAWENAAELVRDAGYRLIILRLGLVLGTQGGILPPLKLSAHFGGASVLGDGRQDFPWIHLDDVHGSIERLVQNRDAEGAFNLCAPERVDQAAFTRALAKSVHRPQWLRVPATPMRWLLGQMADMLLASPPATCQRLQAMHYGFRHPTLAAALKACG
ncbi:TIGR01777 family protein [Ahniella affigens]|uniref:TIGR01777 family protein n=1 Tax=Ahniella affigens TaxID=2021234 RepID=A0A2P1PU09_9GAMM|nr:TIGR01777 family oxidoreductase [Ahniella affigens]AVP98321.1 TIGR01777 family protein [Ahniella affigens]